MIGKGLDVSTVDRDVVLENEPLSIIKINVVDTQILLDTELRPFAVSLHSFSQLLDIYQTCRPIHYR